MFSRTTLTGIAALVVASIGIVGFNFDGSSVRERNWMTVVRDSNYTVAIDTANISRKFGRAYVMWYRTDHAVTHAVKSGTFNRELVQAILLCDRVITFKIESVDLSLGNGRPVSKQRTSLSELYRQKWRGVQSGTVEEALAKVTCDIAKGRR